MPVPKQKHARPGKRAGPVDVHVGSRIRLRRHLLGLSQSELGRALGVTFQQVQKYENGTNRVGASRLHQIALALRTTPAWFFDSLAGLAPAASTSAIRATEPRSSPSCATGTRRCSSGIGCACRRGCGARWSTWWCGRGGGTAGRAGQ